MKMKYFGTAKYAMLQFIVSIVEPGFHYLNF